METGCLPYFNTWCGLSANLECMSEMCCILLAENTGRKKIAILAPSHNFVGPSSELRHVSTIGKNLLSSNIFPTCLYNMVNFGLLAAETVSLVWGTESRANVNGFRVLASLQRRRSPEANQTLHDVWPSPALLHYVYIFGGSCPLTEFRPVQN